MDDDASRLERVEQRVDEHEERIDDLYKHVQRFDVDMKAIRATLGNTATKADIAGLRAHVDSAVNGLLRDALNAVPARHAALWGLVTALVTAAMVVVAILH